MSLHGDISAMGSQFQIVEARASVRDTLRLEGLEDRVGRINRFTSVADVVEQFISQPSKTSTAPLSPGDPDTHPKH
jgi:hypothetical protein